MFDVFFRVVALRWRHNGRDGVSNHQPRDCLLNCLFKHRSKKTLKLRVTGLCAGNSPVPVNSQHKWPVTRKKFPFDDVILGHLKCRGYHMASLLWNSKSVHSGDVTNTDIMSRWKNCRRYPANKLRNRYVFDTSKRRFNVMITYLLGS